MWPNQCQRVAHIFTVAFFSFGLAGCQQKPSGVTTVGSTPAGHPLFVVKKDGKLGYVDSTGKLVIEFQFDGASDFSEGLATICIGPCKYVKDNPKVRIPFDQTYQGLHGFVDDAGKIVINPRFTTAGEFHHGLAYASTGVVKLRRDPAFKYGYIDKSGEFAIPEQFQSARDFDESGVAAVCIGSDDESRCGFIDTAGKYVINPQYYSVSEFHNGLAWVIDKKGMTPSYIDRTGRIVWKGEADWEEVKQ